MSIVFREYRKEDRGEIQNILIDKKRLDKFTLKILKYKVAAFLGLYRPSIYLIEEAENNKIIGMAVLIHKIDYSFRRMEWWIEAVIVAAEKRKSDFGTTLMDNVFAVLRMRGAKKAYLNFESDNVIAKSFYKNLGFISSKRIFAMYKKPFSSVSPPYKSSPLVPVKSKKQREMLLQTLIPHDYPHDNKGIGFYKKILTFLHLLEIKVAEGITTKGVVSAITFIYLFFMVRVEIILSDMLDAGELEQIVGSEFSKFSLRYWRKIILFVICKGPNCDEWPFPQTLPKVSDVEDLIEFELIQ